MRCMVCCNHIDCAVDYALKKRKSVAFIAERRIHFESAVLLQILIAEDKIVRRCFAGNVNAFSLGFADKVNALLS
mgnify:CR=1 FL=1